MKNSMKALIILAVAATTVAAVTLTNNRSPAEATIDGTALLAATNEASPPAAVPAKLPKLIDLGADKCIPCKLMAPILEELKQEYAGRMNVQFIDVWKNPDVGKQYSILAIPTQIFYDAEGKELFRHVGFFSKQDILAKWKELGVDLEKK